MPDMNKNISALGVAIVVVTCVAAKYAAASSPSVFVPLGIGMDRTTEEVARTMRDVHARVGIDKFVLHAPGHGVRITGAYDEAGYRGVGRRVKAIQDAVSDAGIKVGFLMGPTMNVGINHPWTKFVPANGVTRQFTACPGDPAFRKAFASHCAAVADECRPFHYMMEDDFRFFSDGCHCKEHLKRFGKLKGRTWTRESLREAISKDGALGEEWERFCLADLEKLAADAAKAIHRVSPSTRIGLSCPGGYSWQAVRLARALADGDKPFIRWCGSDYGFDNPMRLPQYIWTPIWSKFNLSDGFECVYEADGAPNTAFYGSGVRLAAAASVVLANGFDGLWYWIARVGSTVSDEPILNLEAYGRVRRDLAEIGKCGREGRPVGVFAASGWAARLLARMGIPCKATSGGVALYSGSEPFRGLDDADIKKILSGNVMLDGEAARFLTDRGFSKEIGAKASERVWPIDFSAEKVCADGSRIGSSFHQNYGMDGSAVMRLEVDGGEEISFYCAGKDMKRVRSSMIRHRNSLGGRTVVMAASLRDCIATNVLNFRKRDLLVEAFEWLDGNPVSVRTDKDVNVMLFANERAAGESARLFVHATEISCEPRTGLSLVVAPPYRGGRAEVLTDGEWKALGNAWNGSVLKVPRTMHVYDFVAVRIFPAR